MMASQPMTEEQAKTKWCPFARSLELSDLASAGGAVNRSSFRAVAADCRCIGSDCAKWGWVCAQGTEVDAVSSPEPSDDGEIYGRCEA